MKKASGWILVFAGTAGFIVDRVLMTGVDMQLIAYFVLLAPVLGLYLLVDAYLKIEDGNVLTAVRPPWVRR